MATAAEPPSEPPASSRRWSGGRIAMMVIGSLVVLVGLAAAAAGGLGLFETTQRNSDGYLMTSSERFATSGYALATRSLEISGDVPSFVYGENWLGTVRVRGESANPSRPLFIGIARRRNVQAYLAGVAHSDVVDVQSDPFKASYAPRPGGRPPVPPVRARFWVARASGSGTQTVSWKVKSGSWSVVVMRPDGSRGVAADVGVGAKLPALVWVSLGVLLLGLALLGSGITLIYFGARERHESPPTPLSE